MLIQRFHNTSKLAYPCSKFDSIRMRKFNIYSDFREIDTLTNPSQKQKPDIKISHQIVNYNIGTPNEHIPTGINNNGR